MKLFDLHSDNHAFDEYVGRLKILLRKYQPKTLTEGKKIVVTTEIIDEEEPRNSNMTRERTIDDGSGISSTAREEFITKAKSIGNFNNPEWVGQMVNGLKQAGVQGLQPLAEDDKPVTNKEIKDLIGLLINLISSK